jgi:vacuolar-type H+-ATPase subunit D/Vma8
MKNSSIKKQVESYLPLLSFKQQTLVLEMIKSLLNVDMDQIRISRAQYNKEISEALARIEAGSFVTNEDAEKELSKW